MTTRIPKIPALKVFVEVMQLGTVAQVADKQVTYKGQRVLVPGALIIAAEPWIL